MVKWGEVDLAGATVYDKALDARQKMDALANDFGLDFACIESAVMVRNTSVAIKLAYVIGTMWDGGNVAHYSPDHPRVLIDGKPERAPWIELNDLLARGAVVVWTDGGTGAVPITYRNVAVEAQVQPPFTLRARRGDQTVKVGWAILLPRPSYAALPDPAH